MINHFFKNKGPFDIGDLLELSDITEKVNNYKIKITDIKDLTTAKNDNITFLHSKKYESLAKNTQASFCITTKNLSNVLPKSCNTIIVDNVLIATAKITKLFYPDSITDNFDEEVTDINLTSFKEKVKFGKNVLIGRNVNIGKNCSIGHNSIIESNVVIGDGCSIGSNVILKKTIVKDFVSILDGCVIGKKGLIINGCLTQNIINYLSIIITNYFRSTTVADHCASAIFFPLTNASPLYFQTLPCDLVASILSSSVQSGITGFLNLALSIPIKKTNLFSYSSLSIPEAVRAAAA